MGRRKKEEVVEHEGLSPETKKSIALIILVVLFLVSGLSLFGQAGVVGNWFNTFLLYIFGWSRFVFPLLLVYIIWSVYKGYEYSTQYLQYIGVGLLVLSVNGLFHFFVGVENGREVISLGIGGGYIGWAVSTGLYMLGGFWVTAIILAALVIISLLLIFNLSLSHLLGIPLPGDTEIVDEDDDEENDDDEEDDEPEDDDEDYDGSDDEDDEDDEDVPDDEGDDDEDDVEEPAQNDDSFRPIPAVKMKEGTADIPLSLLESSREKPTSHDVKAGKQRVKKTLETFGIKVEMGEVKVGPTVTQYTLKPARGVKLSKITALVDDLALALAAHPLRIEAPIPGKSLVGIEVPNKTIAKVQLRDILETSEYKKRPSNMMMALGQDVSGKPWVLDLTKMPHLLVAGATGSGKSVCLNGILVSLLYQNSPDHLRLILVDPKRVELPIYNGIPHLLTPVITDVKKTVNALQWAISEMERRLDLLAEAKKRDIKSYNSAAEEPLPYIVIMIDELADLMIVAANEIEASVIRLTQMARAVGIHLILATQRPSVNVITGLIKANVPGRFAFSVASSMDSRTILDSTGAERLIGKGDMLIVTSDSGTPRRVQGAYVGDEEIKNVVRYLKESLELPIEYNEEIVESKKNSGFSGGAGFDASDDDGDELFEDAKNVVIKAGKASASLLQRRLRVGYARAARLIDLLEDAGIVGPAMGSKPREILVTEYEEEDLDDYNEDDE